MPVNYATEGVVDAAAARVMLQASKLEPGTPYICQGKGNLDARIEKYNAAARHGAWFILRDQNSAQCAGQLARKLLLRPVKSLCLRIVPREIEAWLMGDRRALGKFLSISEKLIPLAPEAVLRPKELLVHLAGKSPKRLIREEMTPRKGSGIPVGPNYGGLLLEFIETKWHPGNAAQHCPALDRALVRLSELRKRIDG